MAQTSIAPRTPSADLGNQGMAASGGMSSGIFDSNTSGGTLGSVMMLRAGGDMFRDMAGFRCLHELLLPAGPMDPICFMLWL
ncbi:hypothetical protein CHS0354_022895 [Potamilus streckersoni]|uniref:Uncharacterized protein n=1 Tax=Potamilus streckersoni TaxID=2493646 RepID=A0AAE0S2E6_9BIVA|nr:hypothetical protein CHS0354_022895 [Potamilus streckersoni]